MDVDVYNEYNKWVDRNYLQALTCPYHEYHRLIPIQEIDELVLTCPRGGYRREVGGKEVSEWRSKISLATLFWRSR